MLQERSVVRSPARSRSTPLGPPVPPSHSRSVPPVYDVEHIYFMSLCIIGRSFSSASKEAHIADVSTATLLAKKFITGTYAENNGCSAAGLVAGS